MATPAAAVINERQTGTQQREYTLELESSYGAPGKSEVLLSFPSRVEQILMMAFKTYTCISATVFSVARLQMECRVSSIPSMVKRLARY